MQTLITIAPIFILIALGWGAARTGFLAEDLLAPFNRLIYYFAIPAFLFHAISNFPLAEGFNGRVVLTTLGLVITFYLSGWLIGKISNLPPEKAGILASAACNGNHGYIGLPVAFYFLGKTGLAQAGILAGFLMVIQNVMSASILQSFCATKSSGGHFQIFGKFAKNPVIVSVMLGILVSGLEIPIPEVIDRTLSMLGDLAPAAALLLIGASISLAAVKQQKIAIFSVVFIKLLALPACAIPLFTLLGVPNADFLPAIILLATPTATVIYVLSRQMGADSDIAGATISVTTLLSAITIPIWLAFVTG